MSQNPATNDSSDDKDGFDIWDTLVRQCQERAAWFRFTTPEVCRGGLGFHCSEPALFIGGSCRRHFVDEVCRPRPIATSDATTPTGTTTAAIRAAAPRLAPVPATETCNLLDLIFLDDILADDGDATSEYNEAGAPTTEGGDVENQHESSEVDDGAAAFDFPEGDDPAPLLAASIPLPDAEEDDDLEEVDEPAGRLAEPEDTGSTFRLPGVKWSWPSEASVASLVRSKAETRRLLRIFPPAQGSTKLASDRLKCTARARISPDTGRWEAHDCSQTFKRQYDWRRHLLTIHLAGSRWEDVAKQKNMHADDSTSTAAPVPKKPRAKREPRQAQALAFTSASASTSSAGPPPEVQPKKLRQKRKRQVIEDESSENEYNDHSDQGDSDPKGKKARRW